MGWEVQPDGLPRLLVRLHDDYAAAADLRHRDRRGVRRRGSSTAGSHDPERVAFLDAYLRAVHAAMAEGVDVRGVFVWSLLDNFEWAYGYDKRFGIVHVDYDTQRRTPKTSARWYARRGAATGSPAARGSLAVTVTGEQPADARRGGPARGRLPGDRVAGDQRRQPGQRGGAGRGRRGGAHARLRARTRPPAAWSPGVPTRSPWSCPSPTSGSSATRSSPAPCAGSTGCSPSATCSWCCCWPTPGAEEARTLRYLSHRHVDGAVVVSHHRDDGLADHLAALGLPCVFVGRPWTGADRVTYVDVDNVAGGREATQVLVDRGCRRIGTIAGPADMTAGGRPARTAGTRRWAPPACRPTPSPSATSPRPAARPPPASCSTRHPDLDGIAVASDLMAAGALRVLADGRPAGARRRRRGRATTTSASPSAPTRR